MKKSIFVLALTALLAGCGTAPVKTSFQNSRTYTESYDAVWEQLVGFFASHNIALKNIAKDSGVIYAESSSFDPSFADCGKPPFLFVPRQNIMSVNVFVQRHDAAQTVSVNTTFRQVLAGPQNSTQIVDCYSRGVVEDLILNSIH